MATVSRLIPCTSLVFVCFQFCTFPVLFCILTSPLVSDTSLSALGCFPPVWLPAPPWLGPPVSLCHSGAGWTQTQTAQRQSWCRSEGILLKWMAYWQEQVGRQNRQNQEHMDEMQHTAKLWWTDQEQRKGTDIYSAWLIGKWRQVSRWVRRRADSRQVSRRGRAGNQENEEGRAMPTDTYTWTETQTHREHKEGETLEARPGLWHLNLCI